MKTKLLKKIRKRFNWFIGKDGVPVLVDIKEKVSKRIDLDYYISRYTIFETVSAFRKEVGNIDEDEFLFNVMILEILIEFGYSKGDIEFNRSKRMSVRGKNYYVKN